MLPDNLDVSHLIRACRRYGMRAVMEALERKLVHLAMVKSGNVCEHAALELGLNRTTLVEKRRKFGMLRSG